MSDNDNDTDSKRPAKTLSVPRRGVSETGRVKQSFSHGRSKSVVVETRRAKKLTTVRDDAGAAAPAARGAPTGKPKPDRAPSRNAGGGRGRAASGKGGLSDEEHARRVKALEAAKKAAASAKAAKEAAERKKIEDAAAAVKAEEVAAQEAAAAKVAEEAAAQAAEEAAAAEAAAAAAKAAEEPAAEKAAEPAPAEEAAPEPVAAVAKEAPAETAKEPVEAKEPPRRKRQDDGVKTGDAVDISALTEALPGPKIISRAPPKPKAEPAPEPTAAPGDPNQPRSRPRPGADTPSNLRPGGARAPTKADREERGKKQATDNKRRSGKLTIQQATGDQSGGRRHSVASMRRRQEREKRKQQSSGPAAKVYRDVKIPDTITVQELANRMTERAGEVVKTLMKMDMMVTINEPIDAETAQLVVEEFGHKPVRVSEADVEVGLVVEIEDDGKKVARAPVVTIMGHVDHGKTSLLDKMRDANVVSGEAGGITQHIGAYQVKTDGGVVTFLDTPGHAAFTSMRSRGAQVTDIVILVVAADDSVMPQTIEAIAHAKAADVPMIVAINKMDRPAADAQRVRTQLLQHDVQVEGMGGEVLDVEVSAMTGAGLDKLLEAILLQSEVLDLKASEDRAADGVVVEAQLDVGRGPVATVLVQGGTLRVGDIFVVGEQWGKVRALVDDHGQRTKSAGPSVPVEVLGLNGTPEAGDQLVVVETEKRAEEITEYRQRVSKEKKAAQGAGRTLDQMLAQAKADETTAELPVVIKGDVQGSVEAIIQAVEKIGNDEVKIRVLHSGVGAITESDVTLAEASGASIIGFNVRANAAARNAANQKSAEIRYYSIIYNLLDDLKAAATGLLSPEIRETFIGYAKILQVFRISGTGNVAGCQVTEGVARREAGVRLLRDDVVIHEGKLKTLKRFKDEVKEVQVGQECGMAFERYEDMREGDVIEIFETKEVERTLE